MQAYVLLSCNSGNEMKIISEFKEVSEITEINGVWGKYDIFVKISSTDTNKIDQLVHKFRNHPDVTDTYTMHVLYGQGGSIDDD
ncbi:Lrp/AsnC ligand binding domain-containing protein [Nitrosopumilus sp.]|uniref:Lrp/AsnC ligand binding domain-containing protein n=1 Tax=Nitrosopumilus sp. TaxID=2024843 RepID=UPI003D0F3DA4